MIALMHEADAQQREFANAPPEPAPTKVETQKSTRTQGTNVNLIASSSSLTIEDLLKAEQAQAQKTITLDPSRQRSLVALIAQAQLDTHNAALTSSTVSRLTSNPITRPAPRASTMPNVTPSLSPPRKTIPKPLPRTISAPSTTGNAASRRNRGKATRASGHVPIPAVLDQALEDELDRAVGRAPHTFGTVDQPSRFQEGFQLPFEPIVFPANSYTISLVLDSREVKTTKNRDYIRRELKKRGVNVVKRTLELGDICWTATRHDGVGANAGLDEASLDFILERKRIDDLVESIKDTRFHEQKVCWRLFPLENEC